MPTTSRGWQTSINTQGLMFDKKTIETLRKDLKFSDPGIFEKTVRVFILLESLLKFYPDLIFTISPKTIGLRLTEGRDMEYLKQIVDIGSLFDIVKDITDIRKTFIDTSKMENEFRKSRHLPDEILDDITEVAFRYSQWLIKGADNSFKEIEHINKGFERLSNHLVARLRPDDLKVAFAKVAYVAQIIRDTKVTKIIKDMDLSIVDGIRFDGRYKILDGLKKRNTPAYFYWALAFGAKG